MLEPAIPNNEVQRLATLRGLNILDTPPEERFDRLTRLAQRLLDVPIVLVSLVDSNRQWFKSCQGLDATETPRSISFCGHAILDDQVFIIPDASLDPRFVDNPLVTGAPNIRFYAGQPLKATNGSRLGTLCIIDSKPHYLTQIERNSLRDLALLVENELNFIDTQEATHALINSESRLTAVLENILDGIITINETGIVESFNKSAATIFGYAAEEVIGNNVKMLMPEPYHSEHDGYLNNFSITGKKKIIGTGRQVVGRRKNGSTFPMDLAVSEMKLGDARMFTGIVRDITERKQAEHALTYFKNTLDQTLDCVFMFDADSLLFTYFNEGALRQVGYTREELLGMHPYDIKPDITEQLFLELIAPLQAGKQPSLSFETVHQHKNGLRIPVEIFLQYMPDSPPRFVAIVRDISERNLAIERQRDDAARIEAILNNVIDGIITINEIGTVESFNKSAVTIFGYAAEEVIGNNIKMLMPDPYHSHHDGYLHNYMTTGARKIIGIGRQVSGKRKDGSTFPMDLAVSEMRLGEKRMFTGIVRDITERVKNELMKSEFISTVSHELRTPLTSIRGSLGLIAGGIAGELPAQVKALVDIAHKNSERLILLVNDILDMEKIEAGKMEFSLKPVKLISLLKQSLESTRDYAEQFKVTYEFDQEQPEVMVLLDENRLQQVLANLLSNAAKFSPVENKVNVSVEHVGQNVRVLVSDHGCGIPEQFRSQIFQKFSQADSSDTRKKGGTGLGLSITKAIVEQMGGRIGFDSQPNVLTTFWIEFPIWQEAVLVSTASRGVNQQKRVLICEDDHDIASLLRIMMEQAGLTADVAFDASQAKQMLAKHSYAAMTIDLGLPDQSGTSLIRELRATKETMNLPIIVVSANAIEGRKELSGDVYSVIDWISKPINQDQLVTALRQAVEQSFQTRPIVLHVEDDPDIVQVVRSIVGDVADVESATSLANARRMLNEKHYNLVILDISLPDGSGKELLPILNYSTPPIPVMVFSASEMGLKEMQEVNTALVKSRTDNSQLLATIIKLINP